MKKICVSLAILFVASCGGPPPAENPESTASSTGAPASAVPGLESKMLDLPLDGQGTDLWCWAASGKMIMDFLGREIAQCRQATVRYGEKEDVDCCNPFEQLSEKDRKVCVKGGWPQFSDWGFDAKNTKHACEPKDHCALSWDELRNQIDLDRPVAFSWRYEGGGGHMMVAIGYVFMPPNDRYVVIHDPWPPGSGDAELITYERYVDGPYKHWRDYYDIVPATEES